MATQNQEDEDVTAEALPNEESIFHQLGRKSLILRSIVDHLMPEVEQPISLSEVLGLDLESPYSVDMLCGSCSVEEDEEEGAVVVIEEVEEAPDEAEEPAKEMTSPPPPYYDPQEELEQRIYVDPNPPSPTRSTSTTISANTTSEQPTLPTRTPVCPLWSHFTEDILHNAIRGAVTTVATHAAQNPWTYVWGIAIFSLTIATVGLLTNFTLVFEHEEMFTPLGSPPARHAQWIAQESGFSETRDMLMIVHSNGENVLNGPAITKVFEALDTLQSLDGYQEVCAESDYVDPLTHQHTCWVWSVTQFWEHNVTLFREHNPSDLELLQAFSQPAFPDGIPIFDEIIFGALERSNSNSTTFLVDALHFNSSTSRAAMEEAWNSTTAWYGEYGLTATEDIDYLSHVPAYMISVGFPDTWATYEFQERALVELQDLQQKWQQEDLQDNQQQIQLDFFCTYGYALEYERALVRDMPLIVVIFGVMLGFTMFVFHKHGQSNGASLWQSRASLGCASVVTIGMSMMSGFGMLFCWGVPFTNITLMAPFIILGVGLDDTFIITGAYFRRLRAFHAKQDMERKQQSDKGGKAMDPVQTTRQQQQDEVVERIRGTLTEVGLSISLTTITTTFAFVLGCISTVPGIRWLCMYASVTIAFDFLYQISFFIALLVLDERRVAGTLLLNEETGEYPACIQCMMNYVCCCCGFNTSPPEPRRSSMTYFGSSMLHPIEDMEEEEELGDLEEEEFFMDRIMRYYVKQLLRPPVKVIVVLVFWGSLGWNIYSTTLLEQRFIVEDYIPKDSYVRPFLQSMEDYSNLVVPIGLYFRHVNQSDHEIQMQMIEYVEEISTLPQIDEEPQFCWVRDMYLLFAAGQSVEEQMETSDLFKSFGPAKTEKLVFMLETLQHGNFTFEEKLNLALSIPGLRDMYGHDIVRDEEGRITASRCFIFIRNLNLRDVQEQIDALHDTREVTMEQPINQLPEHKGELPFFAYDNLFAYWQLYDVAVYELTATTIMGVVAVCVVGFILIPNWSAVLFVGPLIVMLYFNLLGTMQACGIYINAVTYVTVVISIGLLVDFLMHILLRYYETKGRTRDDKVKETLETMGASMLLGGFTTWLGVIPMVFSTTKIFWTLFIAFFAMVTWGLLVGLVLLPVLLSYCGPVVTTTADPATEESPSQVSSSSKSLLLIGNSVTEADASDTTHPPVFGGTQSFDWLSSASDYAKLSRSMVSYCTCVLKGVVDDLRSETVANEAYTLHVAVHSLATGEADCCNHCKLKRNLVQDPEQ